MQRNPVVAMAAEIEAARRVYYAADDARDWPESHRLGGIWADLFRREQDVIPASDADAAQKLENSIADILLDPGVDAERFERLARPLVRKIKRGTFTRDDVITLRSLMPIAEQHGRDVCNDTAARALTHVLDWCTRLTVV